MLVPPVNIITIHKRVLQAQSVKMTLELWVAGDIKFDLRFY